MSEDKALSYVPQIRQACKNLKEAQASKFQLALKLGKHLIDAKETLCAGLNQKSSHGKWMEFRKEHFSEISHSTANVYMALARDWAKYCETNPDEATNSQRAVNLVADGEISILPANPMAAASRPRRKGSKPFTERNFSGPDTTMTGKTIMIHGRAKIVDALISENRAGRAERERRARYWMNNRNLRAHSAASPGSGFCL